MEPRETQSQLEPAVKFHRFELKTGLGSEKQQMITGSLSKDFVRRTHLPRYSFQLSIGALSSAGLLRFQAQNS